MKKFYLQKGTEQEGPFELDDLRTKNIHMNTLVWHEGLSEWTHAGTIDELKGLFSSSTPPPIVSKQVPPPIHKTHIENIVSAGKESETKKSSKSLWWIAIIILLGVVLYKLVLNNSNAISAIKLEVNAPKPVIITKHYDDLNSTIFKEKGTVHATIQNKGGDGNVLLTFHIKQASKSYDRQKSLFLKNNETQEVVETFDEVTRLGGEIEYSVDAIAQ